MKKKRIEDLNVTVLPKHSILEKIRNHEISRDELLSRSDRDAIRTTLLINKYLFEALKEAVAVLKEHGIKIRSVNELLHHIIIAFLESFVYTEIPKPNRELVIAPTIVFNQTPIIRGSCNTLRNTLRNTLHSDDKYSEVKRLLRKAEALKMAMLHTRDEKRKELFCSKINELVGQILEKLTSDDSENAERYRRLAKGLLKGIQGFLEE